MAGERSTAPARRVQAIAVGMQVIADRGLTTAAMQQVADRIGVSQPYVFRLFGSKQGLLLACLDELERRVRDAFAEAAASSPADPMTAMGAAFRDVVADGVVPGLWLQASAAARADSVVSARCRAVLANVTADAARLTGAAPEEVAAFVGRGALVMLLQALGVDLSGGSLAALDSLRLESAGSGPVGSGRIEGVVV